MFPQERSAASKFDFGSSGHKQPLVPLQFLYIEEAKRLLEENPGEELARELTWSAADRGCPEIVELSLPYLNRPRNDPRWHWILTQPIRGAGESSSQNDGHFRSMAALLRHGVDHRECAGSLRSCP
jgi:hypothetical protein